jgi:hypothetical protein
MKLARMRERQTMEIPIGQIHFKKREVVGERFGRLRHLSHAARDSLQGAERRAIHCANAREFLVDAGGALASDGEEQSTLGPEALQERGGRQSRFTAHVGKGEAMGADALDDAGGAGQKFGIEFTASAGRHERTINKRAFTNKT